MSLHLSCGFSHTPHNPLIIRKNYTVHHLDKSSVALALSFHCQGH